LSTAEVFAMPPRFRTAASLALALGFAVLLGPAVAQQNPPVSRIAFGSCADEEKPQPLWDAVLAYHPDLFVFTGDNVYGDVHQGRDVAEGEFLAELRESYAEARSVAGFTRLRRMVPVLATWDDHDYGLNDSGGDFPLKRESQQLFADFWELPAADPRRTREGLYHAEILGPPGKRVQVILLDTRSFRSPLKPTDAPGAPGKERYLPDPDPAKTMLGEAQWRWLAERLREPAEIRVVVSSIQVLAEGHGWERWGNLPAERQRLFDLIRDTGARSVVFVSGDRHIGGIYREERNLPYPIHELTASGINQFYAAADEAGPNRIGPVYGLPNFGTIDIDWWADELRLAVRDGAGQPRREAVIPISDLRPR
jgi:alkaline phosphatase D